MSNTPLPVHCYHCGHSFPSRFVSTQLGGNQIRFYSNQEQCPKCGEMAAIADVFQDVGNVHITGIPHEKADEFLRLLKQRYESKLSASAFENKAHRLDPQLGKAAKQINSSPAVSAAILAVIASLSTCTQTNISLDIKIDAAEIAKVLKQKPAAEILDSVPKRAPTPHIEHKETAGRPAARSNRRLKAVAKAKRRSQMRPNCK